MIKVECYARSTNGFVYPAQSFYVDDIRQVEPTYWAIIKRIYKLEGRTFNLKKLKLI